MVVKRPVGVYTNYFQVSISNSHSDGKKEAIRKYLLRVEPEVPANSTKLLDEITQKCKRQLHLTLGAYAKHHQWVYSRFDVDADFAIAVEVDAVKYEVRLQEVCRVTQGSEDYHAYLKACLVQVMRLLRFEQIGPNCYDPSKALKFS